MLRFGEPTAFNRTPGQMRRGKKKQEKTAGTVEGSDVFKNFQRVSGRKGKTIPVCEEFWEHPRLNHGARIYSRKSQTHQPMLSSTAGIISATREGTERITSSKANRVIAALFLTSSGLLSAGCVLLLHVLLNNYTTCNQKR